MKFTPHTIQSLKASEPRIRRLHPDALLSCLLAIEKQANTTACACQEPHCEAYDLAALSAIHAGIDPLTPSAST